MIRNNRSYKGEDDSLAGIWAIKYLLASGLGYSSGLEQLAAAGIQLIPGKQAAASEKQSQKIAKALIVDASDPQEEKQRSGREPSSMTSVVYLDTAHNIAYYGKSSVEENWRPKINRFHSPKPIPEPASEKKALVKEEAPSPEPKEAPRSGEAEQIVYLKLSELHAFKNHPFQIRDDEEMMAIRNTGRQGTICRSLSQRRPTLTICSV